MYNVLQVYRISCFPIFITEIHGYRIYWDMEIQEYKYYKDTWIKEYIDKRIHKYKILEIQGYRKSDIHKNMDLRIHWYKDTLV